MPHTQSTEAANNIVDSFLIKPASELTIAEVAVWSRLQQSHGAYESPYFRPEFTQAVAAVRDDVDVAVLFTEEQPVGFFPFQRANYGVGLPVGGIMSDFHGVIVEPDILWCADDLIQECGLSAWDFNHLIADQVPFESHQYDTSESTFVDVSGGFAAYECERKEAGSKRLKNVARKKRKLEREVGPLRAEIRSTDVDLLETLFAWKSEQYRQSGLIDLFDIDWPRELLRRIFAADDPQFAGTLSVLFVGDTVAAIDFGMRSGHVLHSWFPVYNVDLAKYSPGNILLVETLRQAESLGITRLHFGKGEEDYKQSFANGRTFVADGSVERRPLRSRIKRGLFHAKRLIKQTPFPRMFQGPTRWVKRLLDSAAL